MYDVHLDGNPVAAGLSRGELNQWLLDIDKEIKDPDTIKEFRKGFNFDNNNPEDFVSFLYGIIEMELKIVFGTKCMEIIKSEIF